MRFDEVKGYGFVAPDNGGEDVFLHVNDLVVDKRLIRPGTVVEFEVEEGDRGLKASRVQLVNRPPAAVFAGVPSGGGPVGGTGGGGVGSGIGSADSGGAGPADAPRSSGDDGLCDVLTTREFLGEVTEMLIQVAPTITVEELRSIRQSLVQIAHAHGWVES